MKQAEVLQTLQTISEQLEKISAHLGEQPQPVQDTDYVSIYEACTIIERGRTWVTDRLFMPEDCTGPINTNFFFIYGLDWHKEGKYVRIKRSSVARIKGLMIQSVESGESYKTLKSIKNEKRTRSFQPEGAS